MSRTNTTVRKVPTFVPVPRQRIGNKNILNRRIRNAPFLKKETFTRNKQVEV